LVGRLSTQDIHLSLRRFVYLALQIEDPPVSTYLGNSPHRSKKTPVPAITKARHGRSRRTPPLRLLFLPLYPSAVWLLIPAIANVTSAAMVWASQPRWGVF